MPPLVLLPAFTKAALAGGAARDLLAPLPAAAAGAAKRVPVVGYTRGGNFVAPHMATRHVAEAPAPAPKAPRHLHGPATTRHQGVNITWPDEAHARLFHLGVGLREGQDPPPGEVERLWQHFRGMVESDPDRPFTEPGHVLDLAHEYASPEWGPLAEFGTPSKVKGGSFTAGDIVSSDAQAAYWRRATQHFHAPMAKALASGLALILKESDRCSS